MKTTTTSNILLASTCMIAVGTVALSMKRAQREAARKSRRASALTSLQIMLGPLIRQWKLVRQEQHQAARSIQGACRSARVLVGHSPDDGPNDLSVPEESVEKENLMNLENVPTPNQDDSQDEKLVEECTQPTVMTSKEIQDAILGVERREFEIGVIHPRSILDESPIIKMTPGTPETQDFPCDETTSLDSAEHHPLTKTRSPKSSSFHYHGPVRHILLAFVLAVVVLLNLAYHSGDWVSTVDSLCSPTAPRTLMGDHSETLEAPWWAPKSYKKASFDFICGDRPRVMLEWTSRRQQDDTKILKVTFPDDDKRGSQKFGRSVSADIDGNRITLKTKLGQQKVIMAPWKL